MNANDSHLVDLIMNFSADDSLVQTVPVQSMTANNKFKVYFDGGSYGTNGYGSWEVEFNGFKKREHRTQYVKDLKAFRGSCLSERKTVEYKDYTVTNNVAEWLSLIGALEWLQSVAGPELYTLSIKGDSQLVINQLTGDFRCKKVHLKNLRDIALPLVERFGDVKAMWHPRRESVKRFGH